MTARTSHVWVKEEHGPTKWPGLVLDWRRAGDSWEALVTWKREGPPRIVTEWLPVDRLTPVPWRPGMGTAYG